MTKTPRSLLEAPKSELLRDVLRRVRIASAVFLRGEFNAPWAFESCDEATFASVVAPGAKRLVVLHMAIEGSFRIKVEDDQEGVLVQQGEAVVLPYCDVHTMGFPHFEAPKPIVTLLPMPPWKELPVVAQIMGDEGPPSRILCGYLHCDDLLFDPVLRALPRVIHVARRDDASAQWREASLQYAVEQLRGGNADMLARIPELVLVDCLQQYAESLPPDRGGWLASLDDPVVGRALRLIHGAPEEDWTVERLAKEAAVSRSILADRFTEAIGQPPMRYLASWRLQLAADLVRTTELGIAEIGARVGYESEAAFSRAFKRHFGQPPASLRDAS
jgi:AraC family transcriptional regulator, alkane utilization regulator